MTDPMTEPMTLEDVLALEEATALRLKELVGLTVGDLHPKRPELTVRTARDVRTVPVPHALAATLRAKVLGARPHEPLFVIDGKALTMDRFRQWVRRNGNAYNFSDLRRSAIGDLLGSRPPAEVSAMLGHKSVDVTMSVYDPRGGER